MRTGATDRALEVMDSCRIRWGRVLERDGDWLVVSAVPLEMADGQAPPRRRPASSGSGAGSTGPASSTDAGPGDVVSIHWDWACERLDPPRLAALVSWTGRELEIANRTI